MHEALARVPVRRAALPDRNGDGDAGERLHRMGVRTLGALRALPRDGLRRRFGNELLDHHDRLHGDIDDPLACYAPPDHRSEEHTSELQSLMRISYAVFCLKKKNKHNTPTKQN